MNQNKVQSNNPITKYGSSGLIPLINQKMNNRTGNNPIFQNPLEIDFN